MVLCTASICCFGLTLDPCPTGVQLVTAYFRRWEKTSIPIPFCWNEALPNSVQWLAGRACWSTCSRESVTYKAKGYKFGIVWFLNCVSSFPGGIYVKCGSRSELVWKDKRRRINRAAIAFQKIHVNSGSSSNRYKRTCLISVWNPLTINLSSSMVSWPHFGDLGSENMDALKPFFEGEF